MGELILLPRLISLLATIPIAEPSASRTPGLPSRFMTFESAAARDNYLPHPIHQAAVKLVVPQLESVIVCDHEA